MSRDGWLSSAATKKCQHRWRKVQKVRKKLCKDVIYGWALEELFVAYKCILLMLTRYVALLTAVSTEHSFVGLCSILLLHRKRTAPTANTVHLLALVCPVSMGPIMGIRVNCSFTRRSRQYRQSKNNSVQLECIYNSHYGNGVLAMFTS